MQMLAYTEERATVIHPTAIVDPSAKIGMGVEIGPYCIVEANTILSDGVELSAQVVVHEFVEIGPRTKVYPHTVLGGVPQDQKFRNERSHLIIGRDNVIREGATISRSTGEGSATVIGDENMIMAYCHIGHNCSIGNNITMANMVGISGHVVVEDKVVFGGIVGVHQYVRIGTMAMIGGCSKIVQDIPPYMMVDGRPARVFDVNVVGLRRNGVAPSVRGGLKEAYKIIYRSKLNISQALETVETVVEQSFERDYLLDFIKNKKFGMGGRQLQHR